MKSQFCKLQNWVPQQPLETLHWLDLNNMALKSWSDKNEDRVTSTKRPFAPSIWSQQSKLVSWCLMPFSFGNLIELVSKLLAIQNRIHDRRFSCLGTQPDNLCYTSSWNHCAHDPHWRPGSFNTYFSNSSKMDRLLSYFYPISIYFPIFRFYFSLWSWLAVRGPRTTRLAGPEALKQNGRLFFDLWKHIEFH